MTSPSPTRSHRPGDLTHSVSTVLNDTRCSCAYFHRPRAETAGQGPRQPNPVAPFGSQPNGADSSRKDASIAWCNNKLPLQEQVIIMPFYDINRFVASRGLYWASSSTVEALSPIGMIGMIGNQFRMLSTPNTPCQTTPAAPAADRTARRAGGRPIRGGTGEFGQEDERGMKHRELGGTLLLPSLSRSRLLQER